MKKKIWNTAPDATIWALGIKMQTLADEIFQIHEKYPDSLLIDYAAAVQGLSREMVKDNLEAYPAEAEK